MYPFDVTRRPLIVRTVYRFESIWSVIDQRFDRMPEPLFASPSHTSALISISNSTRNDVELQIPVMISARGFGPFATS